MRTRKNACEAGVNRRQMDGTKPRRVTVAPTTPTQRRLLSANGGSSKMPTVKATSVRIKYAEYLQKLDM